MLALGKAYIQNIEDCNAGTATLEELRTKFPQYPKMDEVLFNLYYCYNKNGDATKASDLKKNLTENYGLSKYSKILTTGNNPESGLPNPDATKTYERIYDLFIEGNFREAIAQKKTADSIYKNNFWTPQLLYIEAVYYIKERQDSIAKDVLTTLIGQFGNSPLTPKATVMLDVLGRRKQIEEELRNMVVTRVPGDTSTGKSPTVIITQPPKKDTVTAVTPVAPVTVQVPPKDTTSTRPPPVINSSYTFAPAESHFVVLLLNKVDPVFSNEAKNAFLRYNRDAFGGKNYSIELFELNADYKLLLIAPFANAQDAISYIDKTKPRTASEIIPWLKGGKYNFTILTNSNFDLLKSNKDVDVYKAFLEQHFPGKFQ
jgi:outer membrane protein assembly factor BamD (BamD/ComL family)